MRTLIVDDHAGIRNGGVRSAIEHEGLDVVGEATNGVEVDKKGTRTTP